MESAVKISNKMSIKATIKFLIIFLPIFGLLVGIGVGLIVGNSTFATPFQLYGQIGAIVFPSVGLMILGLSYLFKQINSI
ncbi:MAG: hypothetical protein ACI9LM_003410 [Alteromonadaceae bacterium]|jgi:hypothetical protein